MDWPVKKEWKQDCTYVDHSQLTPFYHLKSYHQYCACFKIKVLVQLQKNQHHIGIHDFKL